jgi:hypothetical protein
MYLAQTFGLLFQKHRLCSNLTKNWFGYNLGESFTNSSGHPGWMAPRQTSPCLWRQNFISGKWKRIQLFSWTGFDLLNVVIKILEILENVSHSIATNNVVHVCMYGILSWMEVSILFWNVLKMRGYKDFVSTKFIELSSKSSTFKTHKYWNE